MQEEDTTAVDPEDVPDEATLPAKPEPEPVDDDGEEVPGEEDVPEEAIMSPQEAIDNVTVDDSEQEDPGEPPDAPEEE